MVDQNITSVGLKKKWERVCLVTCAPHWVVGVTPRAIGTWVVARPCKKQTWPTETMTYMFASHAVNRLDWSETQ